MYVHTTESCNDIGTCITVLSNIIDICCKLFKHTIKSPYIQLDSDEITDNSYSQTWFSDECFGKKDNYFITC